uniref:Peptidyl-prolyl cis-trans isomerase n=1 Tax=Kalanchoe fedtschenkoi TaxID=63787 RepID=A0A7N0T2E1_KALFE
MARIKPQTLLLQSKKKKVPNQISVTSIFFGLLIIALIVLSLVATYRHWSGRSSDQVGIGSAKYLENDSQGDQSKIDVPGFATFSTSKGEITVELYKESSPEIVDKFIDLCQKGHFKGMPFHRVIKNYVIQVGDSGSAEDWTLKVKRSNLSPKHEAFMIGTSKTKQDAKRFPLFITTAPIPNLSDKIIVFGRVIKGEDVVQEIEEVDTDEIFRPKSAIGITTVALKHQI